MAATRRGFPPTLETEHPRRRSTDVVASTEPWLSTRRLATIGSIATAGLAAIAVSRWHPSGVLVGAVAATAVWAPVCAAVRLFAARQRYERERLLRRLVEVSDIERRRIAGEVHDGVLQDMVGISFSIEALATRAPAPDDVVAQRAADGLRGVIVRLRSLLLTMYPVEVPTTGWVHGFEDLADELRASGVAVEVAVDGPRWSQMNEVLALRVARESLRNVATHARARRVRVTVDRAAGHGRLVIADDGIGFEQATAQRRGAEGHFGLRLSQDLAREMGAALQIRSVPGRGTEVELLVKDAA